MKLTHSDREAFVNAVIRDIPTIDYNEQARDLLITKASYLLPPKIQEIWNDPTLRSFIIKNEYISTPYGLDSVYGPMSFTPDEELKSVLQELADANKKQKSVIDTLRDKLKGMIKGCSTLKQAADLMPEFVKYLPEERRKPVTKSLPALTSVVTELHDLGWPKDSVANT